VTHLFLFGTLSSEDLLFELELLYLVFERVIYLAADFRHFAGLTSRRAQQVPRVAVWWLFVQ
jgi:hypothetical protein